MTCRSVSTFLVTLAVSAVGVGPAWAGTLKHDFEFAGNLANSRRGPALTAFGGTVGDRVYTFGAGQGLRLKGAGIKDDYAIEITFRLDAVNGYRKVVDLRKLGPDLGLYVRERGLVYYDDVIRPSGTINAGDLVTVVLERNKRTKRVRGIINSQVVFEFDDPSGHAVIKSSLLHFFMDDRETEGREVSAGAVTRIRIYKGTLSKG